MSSYQRIPRHSPRVAARVFSGEAVVITPAENTVRMFNQVGSRIWELVDGVRTEGTAAQQCVKPQLDMRIAGAPEHAAFHLT